MQPSRVLFARNFFEVAKKLPGTGVGAKLQRKTWPPESYWIVTGVQPTVEGNHGKAWGIFTWKGVAQNEEPTRVRGTLKKAWRLFEDPSPRVEWKSVAPLVPKPTSGSGKSAAAEAAA